jgi:cytochrome d ubiquinol oxidase subunit I
LLATICSLAQLGSGHFQAIGVYENQPAKLAAMEGVFETETYAPMHLFGWPSEKDQKVHYSVAIPGMLSWLVHFDASKPVQGLNELKADYGQPPVWLTFQSYHLMVAIGMLFIAMTLYASFLRWRGTLFTKRWLLWCFVFAVVPALVANEAGWVAAEVGRQPWIVYPTMTNGVLGGGLRTADAVSEAVTREHVLGSLIMFGLVYFLLFILWIMLLNKKIQHGPEPVKLHERDSVRGAQIAATRRPTHERSLTEAD